MKTEPRSKLFLVLLGGIFFLGAFLINFSLGFDIIITVLALTVFFIVFLIDVLAYFTIKYPMRFIALVVFISSLAGASLAIWGTSGMVRKTADRKAEAIVRQIEDFKIKNGKYPSGDLEEIKDLQNEYVRLGFRKFRVKDMYYFPIIEVDEFILHYPYGHNCERIYKSSDKKWFIDD